MSGPGPAHDQVIGEESAERALRWANEKPAGFRCAELLDVLLRESGEIVLLAPRTEGEADDSTG